MPPYSSAYMKRKATSTMKRGSAKRIASMVRKSYLNYPVYQAVRTAPAPRRVELKYDYGTVNGTVSNVPAVVSLLTVPNGNGSSERIGKMIQLHDMEISWHLRMNAVHNSNRASFMIVYDKSPNGVIASQTEILQSTDVNTLQNCDTRARFTVLFDNRWVTTNTATGDCSYSLGGAQGHKIISLKGKKTSYIGTTQGIADIETGALYIVTNSYSNNVVALEFTNKIQFSDA